jgi:hypothetical protein
MESSELMRTGTFANVELMATNIGKAKSMSKYTDLTKFLQKNIM